ncbi:MAG: hypothetical protein ACJ79S_15800 [Gemmatimonadaceae bacterium]
MYAMLEREAAEAGLPLNWPPRLPDTRRAAVTEADMLGREYGVTGTPEWLSGRRLIVGLRPRAVFERL